MAEDVATAPELSPNSEAQAVAKEVPPASPQAVNDAKNEGRSLFHRLGDEQNQRLISVYIDIALRAVMAFLFYWLTRSWLLSVMALLEKQQEAANPLGTTVLVTLLTTTTLNVLGLVTAVAVYLFPRNVRSTVAEATRDERPTC